MSDINAIRQEIKNMKPHIEKKDINAAVVNPVKVTSLEVEKRCEDARKQAHSVPADVKRGISMEIKKLSESFEFIEESFGTGSPEFEFYSEPQQAVSEGLEMVGMAEAPQYPIIGRASGVFAPIGVMSRNNRIYDEDHYDHILANQRLLDKINHRGMLGTIGHHDKKVDDQDLADGKVSHIVTDLHIKEEADGTRNLYGTLEILDTPAGHLLKTYYDSGLPLFVSSRGGGSLIQMPNESFKRVDKTKYFLETFDIVKEPGFLQAKPVYEKVTESKEETKVEAKEEVNEDRLEKLIGIVADLTEIVAESKKEKEDAEDNEKEEKKETKETKEKSLAKETAIKECDCKDKKEKEEEEKEEEAEDVIADEVSENFNPHDYSAQAELSKEAEGKRAQNYFNKAAKKLYADENQLHTITKDDLMQASNDGARDMNKQAAMKSRFAKQWKQNHPEYNKPVEQPQVKQLSLYDRLGEAMDTKDLANKLAKAVRPEEEPDVKPLADEKLADTLAARLKKGYKENK